MWKTILVYLLGCSNKNNRLICEARMRDYRVILRGLKAISNICGSETILRGSLRNPPPLLTMNRKKAYLNHLWSGEGWDTGFSFNPSQSWHWFMLGFCRRVLQGTEHLEKGKSNSILLQKKVKMFAKKIVQKMINHTFLKRPCHFKYAKSFLKF